MILNFYRLLVNTSLGLGKLRLLISIVTPGEDLPAVKKVTGVEVVIHDAADVKRKDYSDRIFLISS